MESKKYADAVMKDAMPVLSLEAMPLTNTQQQGATFSNYSVAGNRS